jgi:hypothetical protein
MTAQRCPISESVCMHRRVSDYGVMYKLFVNNPLVVPTTKPKATGSARKAG